MRFSLVVAVAQACSNILVTPGAGEEGSMVSYNADDAALIGAVPRWPAAVNPPGTMREVFSWDLGIYLGSVPDANVTYNVMGNANEWGVVIGETTHGGLEYLSNVGKTGANGTFIDYGSLIWMTLQRSKTAREAVEVMVDLAETYGYASAMEGFSIGDPTEVWYMELLGRGADPGILYVALKIPDGYFMAHANQARIQQYMPCDPATCLASPDLYDFAVAQGLYSGKKEDLSFSDVFDPVTFQGARFCEARVWYIFTELAADFDSEYYLDYVRGADLTRRMPLWLKPNRKLTRQDIHALMSSHYEASWLDPAVDVGAAAEHTPYRWNGLEWEYDGQMYVNERPVGTQATGWHYVAVMKDTYPAMKATLWWGADDHSFSPKIPLHGGATTVHISYDDSFCMGRTRCRLEQGLPGSITAFSASNAWWINNVVADQVYTRYDRAKPLVEDAKKLLDEQLQLSLKIAEEKASAAFARDDDDAAVAILSAHATHAGAEALAAWTQLWHTLLMKFIDGRITKLDPDNHVCGCVKEAPTFSPEWLEKVLVDTGDKYIEYPDDESSEALTSSRRPIDKLSIKGVLA